LGARTIQIFLPDGHPRGVRIAEITSRTVQVIQVPRTQLEVALARPEISSVGVYFLLSGESEQSQVYVGEAEDCGYRLRQHHKQKEFWSTALVVVSRTRDFTKSHVKYLEWFCHQAIERAGRFSLENSSIPTKSHVSEAMEADLADHFDTMTSLVGTLGFPLFEPIPAAQGAARLVCRGKDAEASGSYTSEGLVVHAGSTANRMEVPSAGSWVIGLRDRLKASGVLIDAGNVYRFAKDHVFDSPSAASAAVLARRSNGWIEWKYPDGRTLDEVIRQSS